MDNLSCSPGSQIQSCVPQSQNCPEVVCPAYATVFDGDLAIEPKMGRAKMNKKATTRDRFIEVTSKASPIGPSERPWGEFYHLLRQADSLALDGSNEVVARRLVALSEEALAFRRYDLLKRASDVLRSLPVTKTYKTAALYYHQLCVQDLGRGDLDRAEALLGSLIQAGGPKYRGRALTSLGAIQKTKGDCGTAFKVYTEARRVGESDESFDLPTVLAANKMIAVLKSLDGSHNSALRQLESMLPLAKIVERQNRVVYEDYLNSLAVELAIAGRWQDARSASSLAIASPYEFAYPEWHDTYDDIMLRVKSRSVLYLDVWPPGSRLRQRRAKILTMPTPHERPPNSEVVATEEPARVIDFPAQLSPKPKKRKTRMGKPIDRSEIAGLSADEKKFVCSQILMERSDDNAKLDALYNALPSDLRARALIELVIGTALQDDELTAVLDNLMSDDIPKGEIGHIQSIDGLDDPEAS